MAIRSWYTVSNIDYFQLKIPNKVNTNHLKASELKIGKGTKHKFQVTGLCFINTEVSKEKTKPS